MIDIKFFNPVLKKFLPKAKIRKALEKAFLEHDISNSVVRIIFMDNNEIRQLNAKYLNHDWTTDVITFPSDENEMEGEIYIGAELASEQAKDYGVSFSNEIVRLAIHGTLHLLGYDDSTESERQVMHELENYYIGN